MKISLVVPVYNEEDNVPDFISTTVPVLESVTADYEIIFAHDPSPDKTKELILRAHEKNKRIKLLEFSRRFGQPMATLAGLQYSTGDVTVVIDVDLQDPPQLIPLMIAKWQEGFDVVYAQRRKRDGETWIKRLVSYLGYQLIDRIAEVKIPPNTGDFRLMSRRVVDNVLSLKESHGFLRGMVALVGFNQTSILFDRKARHSGQGNYNRFLGSLRIGFNGIFCFSDNALTLSTTVGFLTAGIAFLIGLVYFFMKVAGFPFPIGNPTIVLLVLFMGGIQLISVGILGEYIGRIYAEVKNRPRYIVDLSIGFERSATPVSKPLHAPSSPRP